MIRTERIRARSTTRASTPAMIERIMTSEPRSVDDRGRTFDEYDVDRLARLEPESGVVRPGRPDLAGELDPPARAVRPLQHDCLPADERFDARPRLHSRAHVAQ